VLAAVGGKGREIEVVHRRPVDREQQLALHLVAHAVDVGGPAPEIARLDPAREALVRGAAGERGDRRVVVGTPGAVRELQVVQEAGVAVVGDGVQEARAERGFELVLVASGDGVDLVQ
jgi:hypothetical protein